MIYKVFDDLSHIKNAIFLAGGTYRIPNNHGKEGWRNEAISHLLRNKYKGDIIVPEWKNNDKPHNWTYEKQVKWEVEGLYKAAKILFWFPRNMEDLPCLTSNIEFGNFIDSDKIYVGGNDVKNDYIKQRLLMNNKKFFTSLEELCKEVCKDNV